MDSRALVFAIGLGVVGCSPKPGSVEPTTPPNTNDSPNTTRSSDAARAVKGVDSPPADRASDRASTETAPPPSPAPVHTATAAPVREPALNLKFEPKTGLVRVHYDARFKLDPDSNNLTFLEPVAGSGITEHALVTVTTNPDPISQVTSEYANVLQVARQKALTGYALLSMKPGQCFHELDGVEARWEFDETVDGKPYKMNGRACAFIHHKHGYSVMYAFDPTRPEDEPKLRRIVEAVELTD